MRTTLKRGVGRGAAVTNGNGRSVLPPDALSAVTRYRQPPPPRRRLGRLVRGLLWLVAGVLMLAGGGLGGLYLWGHERVKDVAARSPEVRAAQEHLLPPVPGQAAVALVVGYDHRAGVESDSAPRSDTIMLVRADPVAKAISMLSFPRDLLVDVRCPGRLPVRDRINTAFTECGIRGTLETVQKLTGVPVNYLVTVDFNGFKKIVQHVGGVWLDVDQRYFNDNSNAIMGVTNYARIDLKPGYQRLNGGQALDYVRYRHGDSDLYRNARQQLFVRSFKQQVSHSLAGTNLFFTLPKLVAAITHSVEVGVGGGKPVDFDTLVGYARFLHGLPAGHFFQSRIEGLAGYAELTTDSSNIQAAVRDFLAPDVAAPKKATSVVLGRKPKVKVPLPADTTVSVLNGNGQAGSATDAGSLLGQRGYRIVLPPNGQPANAPNFDYFRSKVYYDRSKPGARQAARKVANLFGSADVGWTPPAIRPLANGSLLTVVVGKTFHGMLGPAPVDRTPEPEPPKVAPNRAGTEELLREQALRRVPFRIQVPTVLDATSFADRQMPLRVYKVAPRQTALRLTFRLGNGDYWGIEETAWDRAPILGDRSFRHVIKGRVYDLYYDGPKLHMVVLRDRGATYWVVNTLFDGITNETMLAIAKGLQPLGPAPGAP